MSRSRAEERMHKEVWRLYQRRAAPRSLGFHPPNGGKRSMSEAMAFQEMGLVPGVSDLVFVRVDGRAFFLELKTPKGRLSEAQEDWRAGVLNTGAEFAVARSTQEAEQILLGWQLIR